MEAGDEVVWQKPTEVIQHAKEAEAELEYNDQLVKRGKPFDYPESLIEFLAFPGTSLGCLSDKKKA